MPEWKFIPGDPWGLCDRCGFKRRQSQLRREWNNAVVCSDCFEPRHPQLDVRAKPERISVPRARPRPADIEVTPGGANDTQPEDL